MKRLLILVTVCIAILIGYNLFTGDERGKEPSELTGAEATMDPADNDGEQDNKTDDIDEPQTSGKPSHPDGKGEAGPSGKPNDPDGKGEAGPSGEPNQPDNEDQDGLSNGADGAIAVIAQPESVEALVNPFNMLPEDYEPSDLEYPDVRFTFDDKIDKRKLRKEAAEALETMFEAAEGDNVYLAGVSAYRSHETQKALFNRYVKEDGYEKARTYSALPGTSEHESGLAIDVSGSDGKCAVKDCFADTKESAWLEEHAAEYGFIIRYPEGKESITSYKYEPWHLRYVGIQLATELASSGETLEEYYNAVPVINE